MAELKGSAVLTRMNCELESLREKAQLRELEIPEGISLCSNDYLGFSNDPRLKSALMEAVTRAESVGSTGSRLLSGNSREWEELESEFANFAGTEASLYFGSGYAANVGLLSSILKPGDVVFSDSLNHSSLIDGIRLSGAEKIVYPHLDLQFLANALDRHKSASVAKVIVTESLFSMDGDLAPIDELVHLSKACGAELVIDEAHATGVCGPQGRGIAVEHGHEREILAIVHMCGKALASSGSFVCGGRVLRDFLVNRARTFIFSTAASPYLAGQIRRAVDLVRDADAERLHLHELAQAFREGLLASGFQVGSRATHIVPIILGTNERALQVAERLRSNGFAAKAIRPPTVPAGTARIRISLTCKLDVEDIHRLVALLHEEDQGIARTGSAMTLHA